MPYSDWISFTRVDGVMLIYHRTSVILMANLHRIRNSGSTLFYSPVTHVHAYYVLIIVIKITR